MKFLLIILVLIPVSFYSCHQDSFLQAPMCRTYGDYPEFNRLDFTLSDAVSAYAIYETGNDHWEENHYFMVINGDAFKDSILVPTGEDTVKGLPGMYYYVKHIDDSLKGHGKIINVYVYEPGPSGMENLATRVQNLYVEMVDGNLNPSLAEVLQPIDTESEAWWLVEEASEHDLVWHNTEELGQEVEKEEDGYRIKANYFIESCGKEKLGLIEYFVNTNGNVELVKDLGQVYKRRCTCDIDIP